MAKRVAIDAKEFCKVYVPMAMQGHSAREIAVALGLPDDEKGAQYVSIKASQLRKRLVAGALAKAEREGLKQKQREELVESAKTALPKLQGRGRSKENTDELQDFIKGMVDKAND